MNNNQTIERLKLMRLGAVASLPHQHIRDNRLEKVTADEYLSLLTDHQWEERLNNKIERLIKQAGFREQASVADVEYTQQRNLDKNMFSRLATLDFIKRKENIIIYRCIRYRRKLSCSGFRISDLFNGIQSVIY